MTDVADRVRKIIVNHLEIDPAIVTDAATFSDLGADSLVVMELVMAFEEEFRISISDKAADKLVTFLDAVQYIEERKAPKGN
jgi:acyl carrier protein